MFNGGKLYHVFETTANPDNPRGLLYTNKFTSDHAREALEKGRKELKVDGECSALHREQDESGEWSWVVYLRRDNHKGIDPTVELPEGKQSSHYNQGGKEHNYSFLKLCRYHTTGKGSKRSSPGPDTYAAVKLAVQEGNLPDPSADAPEWLTFEWVGCKHQSNMDGLSEHHALAMHSPEFLPTFELTSFDEFVKLAQEKCFEGLVVVHPDGTRYKMRSEMVSGSKWEQCKSKKPNEPGVTDFRPQILTPAGRKLA